MRPTRRGYAVIAVAVGAVAAGSVFGARTLDAVVLPGVIALLGGVVYLWLASTPAVTRTLPPAEIAGTERTITVSLEGGQGVPATVRERLPADIDVADERSRGWFGGTRENEAVVDAAVGGAEVSYAVVPRRRGAHTVGPATVVVTDVLGLVKRSLVVDTQDTLVAYPRIGTLPTAIQTELRASYLSHDTTQRDEFDDLREYVRGDALRDVHWKSSARHDELMIMEFTDRADPDRVTVAAGAAESADATTDDRAEDVATLGDRMADAAATVCASVLRGGGSVSLTTPSGTVDASPGRIRPALDHLASAEVGRVPDPEADIVVVADAEGVSVRFDGREHRFEGPIGDASPLRTAAGKIDADTEAAPSRGSPGVGGIEPEPVNGYPTTSDRATDGGILPEGVGDSPDRETGRRAGVDREGTE
jgi:uncharacterized protein (DUF58 family)